VHAVGEYTDMFVPPAPDLESQIERNAKEGGDDNALRLKLEPENKQELCRRELNINRTITSVPRTIRKQGMQKQGVLLWIISRLVLAVSYQRNVGIIVKRLWRKSWFYQTAGSGCIESMNSIQTHTRRFLASKKNKGSPPNGMNDVSTPFLYKLSISIHM
jgi:hypothetical protein